MTTAGIFFFIILLVVFYIIYLYNSLVSKKNQVINVFASTDAILKKRYDLIPNLISTVKMYVKHERDLLTDITEMRAKAVSGQLSDDEKVDLDNKISGMLRGIMVAVENYPDLKANKNFLNLQASLNEVEEQISAARRAYNASVMDYNNALEMFPSNMIASMMRYEQKAFFEISKRSEKSLLFISHHRGDHV